MVSKGSWKNWELSGRAHVPSSLGGRWSMYKLFIQATQCGAVTCLWCGPGEAGGYPWGQSEQGGGECNLEEGRNTEFGEGGLIKYQMAQGPPASRAGRVRAERGRPPTGTHEPPALYPTPLHLLL